MCKKLKDFFMNNPKVNKFGENLVLSIVSGMVTGAIFLWLSDSEQTTKNLSAYIIFILSGIILILFLIVQLNKHPKDKE